MRIVKVTYLEENMQENRQKMMTIFSWLFTRKLELTLEQKGLLLSILDENNVYIPLDLEVQADGNEA